MMNDVAGFFESNGYAVAKSVIPLWLVETAYRFTMSAYEKAMGEIGATLPHDDIPDLIRKIDSLKASGEVGKFNKRVRQILSGQFPLETRLSEEVISVASSSNLHKILKKILDTEELCLHMPPMLRFVLPGNSHAGVPAHQDISYGGHMEDFVTAWIPFVSIDEKCGGVIVHKGSHIPEQQHAVRDGVFWLDGITSTCYSKVHQTMAPGDVLFLNKYTIHESKGNASDKPRISADLRFFRKSCRSTKHFLDFETGVVIDPTGGNTATEI